MKVKKKKKAFHHKYVEKKQTNTVSDQAQYKQILLVCTLLSS